MPKGAEATPYSGGLAQTLVDRVRRLFWDIQVDRSNELLEHPHSVDAKSRGPVPICLSLCNGWQ